MRRDRLAALLLIGGFTLLILSYLWWGRFEYYGDIYLGAVYALGALLLGLNQLYFRESPARLGLRIDNLGTALREAFLPHLAALAVIAAGLWWLQPRARWEELSLGYFGWALLQQHVLQNLLQARFRTLLGGGMRSIFPAALVFGLIHLPSLPLTAFTFFAGLIWCRIFWRAPNLPVVSASHALLGLALMIFFKGDNLDLFRVGRPGYVYDAYGHGVLVGAGRDGEGRPLVVTLPGHHLSHRALVRVFRPDGSLQAEWRAFEFPFSGNLAVGDLGFGPGDEIAVSTGPGTRVPAEVAIFDAAGNELNRIPVEEFGGYGAFVSIGRQRLLLTPGPGPAVGAEILEIDAGGRRLDRRRLPDPVFHNSIRARWIPGPGDLNRLLVWGNALSVNSSRVYVYDSDIRLIDRWETIGTAFGVHIAPLRLGPSDFAVLAAPGPAPGHTPHLKVFDLDGREKMNFFAYRASSPCGANIAALDLEGDGSDEIVLGEGMCPSQPPTVRIMDLEQRILFQWDAY